MFADLKRPLMVPVSEGLELQVHTRQTKHKTMTTPTKEETKTRQSVAGCVGEMQIEMEVFSPGSVSDDVIKLNCSPPVISSFNSGNLSTSHFLWEIAFRTVAEDEHLNRFVQPCQTTSPVKAGSLKWKRVTQPKTRLVVKDVICLPRDCYLAQMDRHIAPRGKAQAALVAMGMTARITLDNSWTANQMESRLVAQFQGKFLKCLEQKFSFTYLQCLQGSGVLFVPDAPAEGWTAEQVLRITGHCPLYILSHLDYPQAKSDSTPPVESRDACSIKDVSPVTTSTQRRSLTLEEFRQQFDICYSCPTDTLRAAEEKTVAHWETVLTVISDGRADFSLEDLLAFITGADRLPPAGFSRPVCLRFYTQAVSTSRARLPYASTSTLDLFLPRGVAEAEDLLALLGRAVHRAPGSARIQTEGGGDAAQK